MSPRLQPQGGSIGLSLLVKNIPVFQRRRRPTSAIWIGNWLCLRSQVSSGAGRQLAAPPSLARAIEVRYAGELPIACAVAERSRSPSGVERGDVISSDGTRFSQAGQGIVRATNDRVWIWVACIAGIGSCRACVLWKPIDNGKSLTQVTQQLGDGKPEPGWEMRDDRDGWAMTMT